MSESPRPIGELRYLGDSILRTVCTPVEAVDQILRNLVMYLRHVAVRENAMGVSANQIGGTQRVFVARIGHKLTTFVNPKLINERGPFTLFVNEGCLSIPNFRTSTRRHAFVTVEWQEENLGAWQRRTLSDDDAQVVQHELDHLDGKLIVDNLPRQQRRQAERLVFDFLARKAS